MCTEPDENVSGPASPKLTLSNDEQSFLYAVITEASATLYLYADQEYHKMDVAMQKIIDKEIGKIDVAKKILDYVKINSPKEGRDIIYDLIEANQPISIPELVEKTHMTADRVTQWVQFWLYANKIKLSKGRDTQFELYVVST